MAFESNLAGVARVAFEAQTGEFNRDVAVAEARYRQSTAGMSDSAIKLELAEARLQRQIAKGPAGYQALARAELAVRRAEAELAAESRRTSGALAQEERQVGRLARGALAGTGVLHGLGRSVAFASTAFLGGTGLVYAVRASVKAAEDHQVVQGQLAAALKASGIDYEAYKTHIDEALRSQRLLTGFTEEDTARAFTRLVRVTGSVDGGLRALAVSGNIARGATISLDASSLKVARAFNGQTRGLTALGLHLEKGVKGWQAIDAAQAKYAGASEAYSRTSAGAQARLTQAIHETEVTIGTALLPTVSRLATEFADWAGKSENQKRIQDDVNKAVKVGGDVVHVLRDGVKLLGAALAPVDDALGGFKNTAELAFGAALLLKLSKTRLGVLAVQKAIALLGPTAVTSAAEADTALNTIGNTALANVPKVEALTAAELTAGGAGGTVVTRIGRYGKPIPGIPNTGGGGFNAWTFLKTPGATAVVAAVLAAGGADENNQAAINKYPRALALYAHAVKIGLKNLSYGEQQAIKLFGQYSVTDAPESVLKRVDDFLKKNVPGYGGPPVKGGSSSGAGILGRGASTSDARAYQPTGRDRIDTALSRTTGQTGQARVAALREELAYDDQFIAVQKRLLVNSKTRAEYQQHKNILDRLYAERAGASSELQSIADAANQKAAASARNAAQKAARREQAYRTGVAATASRLETAARTARTPAGIRRAEDALIAFYKREAKDKELGSGAAADKLRQQYANKARLEATKEHDAIVKAARGVKEATLATAVSIAKIALDKATAGSAAYDKALAAEKKALSAEERFYERLAKATKDSKAKSTAYRKAATDAAALKALDKKSGTAADFHKLSFEFLQSLKGTMDQFGGNLFPAGQLHTQATVQTHLLRRQNQLLEGLAGGLRHPGSRYARTELTAAHDGVGF